MGLDTSHGCWSGAYSAFGRWRGKLAEVAGFGDINQYVGYGGEKLWPQHPLVPLLDHSDCDGELAVEHLQSLADALKQLLPALDTAGDGGGHLGNYATKTRTFIAGLREAAAKQQPIEFH